MPGVIHERIFAMHHGATDTLRQVLERAPHSGIIEIKARQTEKSGYAFKNGIAQINVEGVLVKQPSYWDSYMGTKSMIELADQVDQAAADKAVNAILMYVDSPGGTVAGVSDLADATYRARKKKRVIAYISDLGASAAYYVASQADQIFADADAVVGSIGTYAVIADWSEAAKQIGVKIHVIKAGEFKGAGVPGTEITEKQLAEWQREIDALANVFAKDVARGRGWPVDRVRELATGQVWVGKAAMDLGLIDGVRTRDELMREMRRASLGGERDVNAMSWRRATA